MHEEYLFHVCSQAEWTHASPNHYRQEGPFTHLSSALDLDQSIRLHLGHRTHLILICIDAHKISANLKWETVPSRSSPMPHLYGVLPWNAILWMIKLPDSPDPSGSRCPSVNQLNQKDPPLEARFSLFDFN